MGTMMWNTGMEIQHNHTSSISNTQRQSSQAPAEVPDRPQIHIAAPGSRRADPLLHHPLPSHPVTPGVLPPSPDENHQLGSSTAEAVGSPRSDHRVGRDQVSQSETDIHSPTSGSHGVQMPPNSPLEVPQRPLSRHFLISEDDETDIFEVSSNYSCLEQGGGEEQTNPKGSVVFGGSHPISVGPYRSQRVMSWWLVGIERCPWDHILQG
ncbi:hypothetical protein N431DRAFT_492051 [Stipitochalara longipes BDJ]|nr:hypothetical protein N431DRAFT_492051 [Stipitochalara longipes BDJ]